MRPIYVVGMHGLGDNLHQRAIVRHLMKSREVWLETPWPCVYHDLVGDRLKLVNKGSRLRTQAKNALREAALFTRSPAPIRARQQTMNVSYSPDRVRAEGSVLGAMSAQCGIPVGDFTLPIPEAWREKAARWTEQWKPSKPLLIYRPLNERTEWGGCASRNPDYESYARLIESIRHRYFVVSVADLQGGAEWMVGRHIRGDVELHGGELDFETLAALVESAGLVFSSPGFAVILAQAVGTPVCAVFGGYENGSSFVGGAHLAPYLAVEPIKPCNCFSHRHACDKTIDMPAELKRLTRFVNEIATDQSIAA